MRFQFVFALSLLIATISTSGAPIIEPLSSSNDIELGAGDVADVIMQKVQYKLVAMVKAPTTQQKQKQKIKKQTIFCSKKDPSCLRCRTTMDLEDFEKRAKDEIDMDSTGDPVYFKNVKLSPDKKELTMEHHWVQNGESAQTKVMITHKGGSSQGKTSPSPPPPTELGSKSGSRAKRPFSDIEESHVSSHVSPSHSEAEPERKKKKSTKHVHFAPRS